MNLGGNKIKFISNALSTELESNPYEYRTLILENQSIKLSELKSFTVFIYNLVGSVTANKQSLELNDVVQVENDELIIKADGICHIFIAGVKTSHFEKSVTITKHNLIKKVTKPWGHELWLNGEHPGYAFKHIYIKAPHKTSLQYHNHKSETNMLVSGVAKFHYFPEVDISKFIGPTSTYKLNTPTVISVPPKIIHRVEALTDLYLYEVSTPHLDDVIRLADDQNRPNGKIESEHA